MPHYGTLLRAAVVVISLSAAAFPNTAALDYVATIHGTYSTFQANSSLCPLMSTDPAVNPCITQGSIDMTVPLEWLPLIDGQFQFPTVLSAPLFDLSFLGFNFGDVDSITPDPTAPYVQINANGSTTGQDFNDGVPALPVSTFVDSHLGQPTSGVKFLFSSTGPFDAPPVISFSLDASSNAAETQQNEISWTLDLTGSAVEAPTVPEPATGFLLGLSLVALVAGARARNQ